MLKILKLLKNLLKMENKAFSLREILGNDFYIIPRYQRNYDWGKKEISQLIKDIDEYFIENEKSYYLGALVCFKREDKDGGMCYELIDGQQRLTTLTLINLVLKNWANIEGAVSFSNLKFDSRKKSQKCIEKLYQMQRKDFNNQIEELDVTGGGYFKDAIGIIQEDLRKIESKIGIEGVIKFAENFFNHVFLFRVEVPDDTDLNHYFEIMNNRGEQLEKHEIVKTLLMGKIENQQDQAKFATIWDACSDMNKYVYSIINECRNDIFSEDGNLKIENFSEVPTSTNEIIKKETLANIIANHIIKDFPKKENKNNEKYRSVIDFPNFLLQVLKLMNENENVQLDDKKLVEQFELIKPNPIDFVFELLKYRTLFDKYVIKQALSDDNENSQNWRTRKLKGIDLVKTFDGENDDDDELVKLQVMLYYSDSTNTYNNWLQEILKTISFEEKLNDYTEKVFKIAKNRFDKEKLTYPEITIFNLYFIDLLLWKLYKENIQGIEDLPESNENSEILDTLKHKIFKQRSLFNTFKFKQISSREHLYSQAQSKLYHNGEVKDYVNGIGNLCLISTSQNSAGNKLNPTEKKKMFQNDSDILSLKRVIMFESFKEDRWEKEQIEKHDEEIRCLIDLYT